MKRLAACLALSLGVCAPLAAAQPVLMSPQQLYNAGLKGYAKGNCVTVSRFWFAYLQANPSGLTPAGQARIEEVIAGCEQASNKYASTFAYYDLKKPTRQGQCDIYAELAVAQYEAGRAANCGFSGPRWSPNRAYHAQWCMQAAPKDDWVERQARDAALDKCSPGP